MNGKKINFTLLCSYVSEKLKLENFSTQSLFPLIPSAWRHKVPDLESQTAQAVGLCVYIKSYYRKPIRYVLRLPLAHVPKLHINDLISVLIDQPEAVVPPISVLYTYLSDSLPLINLYSLPGGVCSLLDLELGRDDITRKAQLEAPQAAVCLDVDRFEFSHSV